MNELPILTAEQIVRQTLLYEGTPFHPHGRKLGVAVDCGGLVACVFKDLGVPIARFDWLDYEFGSDMLAAVNSILEEFCAMVDGPFMPGDVIVWRAARMYNHLSIVLKEGDVMTAWNNGPQKVARTPMGDEWEARVCGRWRYRRLAA